jgi:mRNA interferase MazF
VKVPFPYTNRPVLQRRPALVVRCYGPSEAPALLWVLMITSAVHRRWNGDIEIKDLADTGLSSDSIVRSAKIATIEASDAAVIGRLSLADQERVRSTFVQALASAVQA